jgi:mannose-6-phosphate isomerase-like protein (cupin superfamily)
MGDYTVLNLRDDVEDMAPKFDMGDGIEARFARKPLGLEKSGISYFKLGPGFTLPFGHSHSEQEEIYLVVSGRALLKLDDEEVELGPYDAVRIPVSVTRGMAGGPEGAEIIAFGAPNTDNKDIEMVPGFIT